MNGAGVDNAKEHNVPTGSGRDNQGWMCTVAHPDPLVAIIYHVPVIPRHAFNQSGIALAARP